ncbi:MAG: CsbD family protein [Actinomycetes bacterium]
MGIDDKTRNAAENAKGKTKEAAGKVSGNEDLEQEGRRDQATSDVKQAGEKITDAVKR